MNLGLKSPCFRSHKPCFQLASRKTGAKKEEAEDPPAAKTDMKDEDEESGNESDDGEQDKEDVDVRDIRYKLERLGNTRLTSCIFYSAQSQQTCSRIKLP